MLWFITPAIRLKGPIGEASSRARSQCMVQNCSRNQRPRTATSDSASPISGLLTQRAAMRSATASSCRATTKLAAHQRGKYQRMKRSLAQPRCVIWRASARRSCNPCRRRRAR